MLGFPSTSLTNNPYSGSTTGSVISFEISRNGNAMSVSGLSQSLTITLPDGSGVCMYYDTVSQKWKNDGLTTVIVGGKVTCQTTHLTAFGGFTPSSAASVAVSILVVVVAALVQLILA